MNEAVIEATWGWRIADATTDERATRVTAGERAGTSETGADFQ
ncbi:hypothetical protein OB905_05550 [Halobacteria archaeon AArc-dxtr1]|nr:hypothetical protein [Halobacteria archaeon AArc-dxtr1]